MSILENHGHWYTIAFTVAVNEEISIRNYILINILIKMWLDIVMDSAMFPGENSTFSHKIVPHLILLVQFISRIKYTSDWFAWLNIGFILSKDEWYTKNRTSQLRHVYFVCVHRHTYKMFYRARCPTERVSGVPLSKQTLLCTSDVLFSNYCSMTVKFSYMNVVCYCAHRLLTCVWYCYVKL